MPLSVIFYADAPLHIGTGAVMRCLTMPDALGEQDAECPFVCRKHAGDMELITQNQENCVRIEADDVFEVVRVVK